MTEFLVFGFFVALLLITMVSIWNMNFTRLTFADGTLLGAVYFFVIPFGITLPLGAFESGELAISPYVPSQDVLTTFNLLLGWAGVLLFQFLFRHPRRMYADERSKLSSERDHGLWLLVLIYVSFSIVSFALSGKAEGGHWQTNLGNAFRESTFLVLIANLSNCFRTVIFGFLVYLESRDKISKMNAVLVGVFVVCFDVLITFNRVTAVYFFIFFLIVYRRLLWLFVLGIIPTFPILAYLSSVWAIFRALALTHGYSFDSAANALTLALNATNRGGERPFYETLNSLFESSNILVFSFLTNNVPDHFPVLWGNTFLLRPLAMFIPSTLWPDKPQTFGTQLGLHIQALQSLTLNSTLFGEAYANFFYFWIFALLAMLVLLNTIYERLSKIRPYYRFFGCFVAVALWRFDIVFGFISVVGVIVFEASLKVVETVQVGSRGSPDESNHR